VIASHAADTLPVAIPASIAVFTYACFTNGRDEVMVFAGTPGEALTMNSEWYADAHGFTNDNMVVTAL
jgi:hypothetical protein